jgi:hypothetical protein
MPRPKDSPGLLRLQRENVGPRELRGAREVIQSITAPPVVAQPKRRPRVLPQAQDRLL